VSPGANSSPRAEETYSLPPGEPWNPPNPPNSSNPPTKKEGP
jgi:hypothetical protein